MYRRPKPSSVDAYAHFRRATKKLPRFSARNVAPGSVARTSALQDERDFEQRQQNDEQ